MGEGLKMSPKIIYLFISVSQLPKDYSLKSGHPLGHIAYNLNLYKTFFIPL